MLCFTSASSFPLAVVPKWKCTRGRGPKGKPPDLNQSQAAIALSRYLAKLFTILSKFQLYWFLCFIGKCPGVIEQECQNFLVTTRPPEIAAIEQYNIRNMQANLSVAGAAIQFTLCFFYPNLFRCRQPQPQRFAIKNQGGRVIIMFLLNGNRHPWLDPLLIKELQELPVALVETIH